MKQGRKNEYYAYLTGCQGVWVRGKFSGSKEMETEMGQLSFRPWTGVRAIAIDQRLNQHW
jgi:hypothetical protein